ncbi:SCP-like protein [Necator americanus]|uniref:SCP-like protein n=1 Tax=Necator americanus TaxID=51031 RepID=W2TKW2_NECAM|nr:SCP-like protein [Necator americanus]ETN82428.1 SCP-like protein [Necator americanus]
MMILCCRRLLATGWAKSGENYAKPATKMIELQYDKDLEDAAAKKIKNCPATISTGDGENFWKKEVSESNNIGEEGIEKAVAKWWKSFENKGFGDDLTNTAGRKSAAYIAHDAATKVGCAIDVGATCLKNGLLYIMCKYDKYPAVGDVIYEAGNKACSKCASTGTNPVCSPIGGLCVEVS